MMQTVHFSTTVCNSDFFPLLPSNRGGKFVHRRFLLKSTVCIIYVKYYYFGLKIQHICFKIVIFYHILCRQQTADSTVSILLYYLYTNTIYIILYISVNLQYKDNFKVIEKALHPIQGRKAVIRGTTLVVYKYIILINHSTKLNAFNVKAYLFLFSFNAPEGTSYKYLVNTLSKCIFLFPKFNL